MSGVEDIQKDPPDPHIKEGDDGSDQGKEEVTQPVDPVPVTDSSEASSLTGSWTLLEKEEEDAKNVCIIVFIHNIVVNINAFDFRRQNLIMALQVVAQLKF